MSWLDPIAPSSGLQPRDALKFAHSQLPPAEPVVMHPDRGPHPLALGAEPTVMEHPDDILRSVAGGHIQPDEAVRPVAQPSIVEILVEPVHAARTGTARERWCCNRPWSSNHASRANFTASPTAASGMRPPQRV